MYLEDRILINSDYLPEVFNTKQNYLAKCLAEDSIDFYIEDWKKLAVDNLSDKDILYAPYCNIPDHKLKEIYPNIKITKDLNLATKFVISDQLLSRVYNFKTVYDNKNWGGGRTLKFREVPMSDIFRYKEFRKLNPNLPKHEFVYIRDIPKQGQWEISIFEKYPLVYIKPNCFYNHTHLSGLKKQINYVEQLLLAKNNNTPFIFESTILKDLDKDSNVIDKGFYDQLKAMLSSEDSKEHKLAYEIIANCEREKSKIYILLLLNEFAWKLNHIEYKLKQDSDYDTSKKIKNTNYKSLLSYYNLKSSDLLFNWDRFCKTIIEKCELNDNDISILKKFIIEKLNSKYEDFGIKIETICLT